MKIFQFGTIQAASPQLTTILKDLQTYILNPIGLQILFHRSIGPGFYDLIIVSLEKDVNLTDQQHMQCRMLEAGFILGMGVQQLSRWKQR